MVTEPLRRFGFRDDRKDFDGFVRDVIEYSHLSHPKTILGLAQRSQTFDPTLAHPGRLVTQVPFESVPYFRAPIGR